MPKKWSRGKGELRSCPLGLDKVHCLSCYYWRDGQCALDEIMREGGKGMDDFSKLLVAVKKLDKTRLLILSQFINWIKEG